MTESDIADKLINEDNENTIHISNNNILTIPSKNYQKFLKDNFSVVLGNIIIKQTICITMGKNFVSLFTDWRLYSYEAVYIQNLVNFGEKNVAKSFSYTSKYIVDFLSICRLFGCQLS